MTDPALSFPVVTEAGLPGGVRCGVCRRPIDDGQPYESREVGLVGDQGRPVAVIVCVYCPP